MVPDGSGMFRFQFTWAFGCPIWWHIISPRTCQDPQRVSGQNFTSAQVLGNWRWSYWKRSKERWAPPTHAKVSGLLQIRWLTHFNALFLCHWKRWKIMVPSHNLLAWHGSNRHLTPSLGTIPRPCFLTSPVSTVPSVQQRPVVAGKSLDHKPWSFCHFQLRGFCQKLAEITTMISPFWNIDLTIAW